MAANEIIRQIAKEFGVSPEKVEKDMTEALKIGMASDMPEAKETWKILSPDGQAPSIDLFLQYCVSQIIKQ